MNKSSQPEDTHSEVRRAIPGKGYYVLGGAFIGGGIVCFAAVLVLGLMSSNRTDIRVLVPGVETIELSEPGEYTIFHEYESAYLGNRSLADKRLPKMSISLVHEGTAKEIVPYPINGNLTYTARGRKGASAFRFRADEAGFLRLRTEFSEPDAVGTRVLAIKYWNLVHLPIVVACSWLALVLPTALGMFVLTNTAAKRRPPTISPLFPLHKYFR